MAQETSFDISWAFYSFVLLLSHGLLSSPVVSCRLLSSRRFVVVPFGLVAMLPFFRHFVVARVHPTSSCSWRCFAVLPWPCGWPLLLSWCRFVVINQNLEEMKKNKAKNI